MTALERAFQLAKSGQVATVTELKTTLKREGFDALQLEGASLMRQLRGLIEVALVAAR